MSKWYLNDDLGILEYEEDEVASKNLTENGEDKIRDLNRIINFLKIEERKSWRRDEEIWKKKRWINRKEEEERKMTNHPQHSRKNLKIMKILYRLHGFCFLLHIP